MGVVIWDAQVSFPTDFGVCCTSDSRADVPTALGCLLLKYVADGVLNDFIDLAPVFFLFLIIKKHCKIFQALYPVAATAVTVRKVCCI